MSVNEKMTAIADAIREKTGDTAKLSLDGMAQTIRKLPDPIVNTATGNPITLSDATDLKLRGLKLFGKTTQDGTPTPEAPLELVSAGTGGSITVSVGISEEDAAPQTLTCMTPNGLPGIPVTSGGNYTDETGQQWICDEVDFGRGVYVQRVAVQPVVSVTNANNTAYWEESISQFSALLTSGSADASKPCMVTHGTGGSWFNNAVFYAGLGSSRAFIVGGNRQKFGDTVETCNAYLAELNAVSPVKMLYVLATPIETALSAEELAAYAILHTNYPNTTILNDGGAGMSVSYVADTKNYIDNKINAMAAAIVNA